MRKVLPVLIIFSLLLSGCNLPLSNSQNSTPIPIADFFLNKGGGFSATRTPFQPISPTPTVGPTSAPVPTATPEGSTYVSINLPRPKSQVNILLLGSDWRPNQGYRTDVIILLSLNPEKGTATVTSFPRDLYVSIPGVGYERINAAQEYGGFALTQATFQENFDVPVDFYMMTNFYGFKNIIDTLGGVNVNAAYTLTDTCVLPQAIHKTCTIYAGSNLMNGETALWYVRSRHSSNDFDRTRRAQEVIIAIFQKLMSLNAVSRSAELYDLFISSVETNIPLSKIVELLPLASKILANPSIVQRFAIGDAETYDYIVPYTGAMVLIPDPTLIEPIIRQAVYQ